MLGSATLLGLASMFLGGKAPIITNSPSLLPLLSLVATESVPATAHPFVAREKFTVDISISELMIWEIGEFFQECCANRVESAQPETKVSVLRLNKAATDAEVIANLGSRSPIITLSCFWVLLKKQAHGNDGVLLTNGCANVGYINHRGKSCRISAYWRGRGWHLVGDFLGPFKWDEGSRFLIPDS